MVSWMRCFSQHRERRYCVEKVWPHARGALSSNWTIAKVYPKKIARFVSMYILWKKEAKTVWKLLNIVLKSLSCVWDGGGGYLWRSMWMSSSVSSRSTASEHSRLVTQTRVSSPQGNSEKKPLSNSVAFRALLKWHTLVLRSKKKEIS